MARRTVLVSKILGDPGMRKGRSYIDRMFLGQQDRKNCVNFVDKIRTESVYVSVQVAKEK